MNPSSQLDAVGVQEVEPSTADHTLPTVSASRPWPRSPQAESRNGHASLDQIADGHPAAALTKADRWAAGACGAQGCRSGCLRIITLELPPDHTLEMGALGFRDQLSEDARW